MKGSARNLFWLVYIFFFSLGLDPMGGFSGLYLYGLLSPSLYFRLLKITYCINCLIIVTVPSIHSDLTDCCQRCTLPVFFIIGVIAACPPLRTRKTFYKSSDPDWYRRFVGSENPVLYVLALTRRDALCLYARNLREKVGPSWTLSLGTHACLAVGRESSLDNVNGLIY
jgi:hypothetical protein